ncbi:hypothetical protein C8R48DRAFT_778608 [Suillus tomentosus]|nr:hypothetical protein C8R48DRAFT_778608 [Suillus tomentosus]
MTAPQKLESLARGAKTRALENAVWKQDKRKRQTSPAKQGARGVATKKRAPSASISKTPHKQSLGQKSSTLKRQRMESESEASEHDSFSEGDKKASRYRRPTKLRRTFAMQDVNVMLPISENEQSDVDSDDAQRNVHDAGADSDQRDSDSDADAAGLNDSEDDDLDAAARMLSVISRIPDLHPIIFPRLIRTFGCPIHVSSTHPDPCTSAHPHPHVHVQIPYPSQLACIVHPCPIALILYLAYPRISSGPHPIRSDPILSDV